MVSGCVLSECLAWIAGGEEGRNEYERVRKRETDTIAGIQGSGYEACFHDKEKRLRCVDDIHAKAMDGLRKFDNFSPIIRSLVEDKMLQPSGAGRLSALSVWHQFNIAVNRYRKIAVLSSIHHHEEGPSSHRILVYEHQRLL